MFDVTTSISVVFVAALIIVAIYLFPRHPARGITVPGPEPSDKRNGNLPDIATAGSLHQYLTQLHGKYGGIVSFWWGRQLTVSIASPELFREHSKVFDRPKYLNQIFEPLFGSSSVLYTKGSEGRLRRSTYDPCLSHQSVSNFLSTFHEIGEELAKKWSSFAPDEHIALSRYMYALAINGTIITLFGDYFKDVDHFKSLADNYKIVWSEMESVLTEGEAKPGSSRAQKFQIAIEGIKSSIREVIEQRKSLPPEKRLPERFIDVLIDSNFSEDIIVDDAVTLFTGGIDASAALMTWLFYFLAANQNVQEKLYRHIKDELGDGEINAPAISQMRYLRQCLNEALRCAGGSTATRAQDFDSVLGGHLIPKNTAVIHALGVVMQDETIWPQPTKFDPERFDPKNRHPLHAFEPFGFAGKRKCPGYRFSYFSVSVYVTILLKRFKFHLVDDHQSITPVYGLITHPNEEVWITVSKRN